MAEAGDKDTPAGYVWVPLGDYIPIAGEALVRDGLNKGHPCRYRDAWGNLHSGRSLPGGFWLDCEINLKEHSAKRRERVVPIDPAAVAFAKRFRATTPTPFPGPPPLAREHVIPAFEIFCVEVLVRRRVGPTPREESSIKGATEAALELTAPEPDAAAPAVKARRKGFQYVRIDAAAKRLYPKEGRPPDGMTFAELTRAIHDEPVLSAEIKRSARGPRAGTPFATGGRTASGIDGYAFCACVRKRKKRSSF